MTEYEVNGIASHIIDVEDADTPTEAIEKARTELQEALKEGKFQLSEIEAHEQGGTGYAFEGQ